MWRFGLADLGSGENLENRAMGLLAQGRMQERNGTLCETKSFGLSWLYSVNLAKGGS